MCYFLETIRLAKCFICKILYLDKASNNFYLLNYVFGKRDVNNKNKIRAKLCTRQVQSFARKYMQNVIKICFKLTSANFYMIKMFQILFATAGADKVSASAWHFDVRLMSHSQTTKQT